MAAARDRRRAGQDANHVWAAWRAPSYRIRSAMAARLCGQRPVRIGNAAHEQFQLDVYGEVMDSFYTARKEKLEPEPEADAVENALMEFLEGAWKEPDEGIWEVRGPRRQFTHSKMMAWVAADRAVKLIEKFGNRGPADRWKKLRDEIRADVLARGFNSRRNAFVQDYGSELLDGSLLMMPLIGFLPPRIHGLSVRLQQSSANSSATAWSSAIRPIPTSTVFRRARELFSRAPSGMRITSL